MYDALGLTWSSAYLAAINIVAFVLYVYDCLLAAVLNRLKLRVPELILIWLLWFPGGLLGATLAMALTGHKLGQDSAEFRLEVAVAFAIQVAIAIGVVLFGGGDLEPLWSFFDAVVEPVVVFVLESTAAVVDLVTRLIS